MKLNSEFAIKVYQAKTDRVFAYGFVFIVSSLSAALFLLLWLLYAIFHV